MKMETQSGGGGGGGTSSSHEKSDWSRSGAMLVKQMIEETMYKNLDVKGLVSSTCNTFRMADMGCSSGPNTFHCVQNLLETIQNKFQSQIMADDSTEPRKLMFQVFFNDLAANDFNTLFSSLPPANRYFAAGVPGSFHGRLFPDASLHLVHSAYALHWLSQVPPELLDKGSSAWNKGRVFCSGNAPDEVVKAYAGQFAKDMGSFLDVRAEEVMVGGMMVLILPSVPDGMPISCTPLGKLFDHLGTSLQDMSEEGIVEEALADSFNIPLYTVSPTEMKQIIELNGCFHIEAIETTKPRCTNDFRPNGRSITLDLKAGLAGVVGRHFGEEIMDELFDRFLDKMDELMESLASANRQGNQLTVILKRR